MSMKVRAARLLALCACATLVAVGCIDSTTECRVDTGPSIAEASAWPSESEDRAFVLSDEVDRLAADFKCGRREVAAKRAEQVIETLKSDPLDWYFDAPNATHIAHTVLGLVSLDAGDRRSAEAHLLASVPGRGSPQLMTFGPSMALASRLLTGEHRSEQNVLAYLVAVAPVWPTGQAYLAARRAEIESGAAAEFGWQQDFIGR